MFQVAVIEEPHKPAIGRTLRSFRSYPRAKRYAEDVATGYQWGVAILDDVREIVDWGDEFTELDDIDKKVNPPFYARRYLAGSN